MDGHAWIRWGIALVVAALLVGMPALQAPAKGPSTPGSTSQMTGTPAGALPASVMIVKKWDGDFPVAALKKLPRGQQKAPEGYIGDPGTFTEVWKSFRPGEKAPPVDFGTNMVVFTRNVKFYNRKAITRVTLLDGIMEIRGVETMTSVPVTNKVAMAMAEVPRQGVKTLRAGDKFIPVK